MKVVIDTNILLTSISRNSDNHWIFRDIVKGAFELCVTTEILNEYAEILEWHMGFEVAQLTLNTIIALPTIQKVEVYYKWNLIKDADDNKFADCAIASNAWYIVSHDKHFNVLKEIDFPKVEVVSADEFKKLLMNKRK
ncbi:MAG: putative toxin-antitoxin system toxin component, PIN family [Bacteroidales bacterium]|nr:putative toxin-antitoxin system toxin component, PIN family [Bacteroidales bacterium]MCF8456300.1 putative toxin-antitoxin system toxin component, PIN family [Bacteroidales bacterium]